MNPDDPRVSRSRQALLRSSMERLLRNPDASFSDIALHAGVGRATLYRHFQTREQLIQELTKESLAKMGEVKKPIIQESLEGREAIETMLAKIMPNADHLHFLFSLWNIAEKDPSIMRIYDDQVRQLSKWIDQGKRNGEITKDIPTQWIVTVIETLVYTGWTAISTGALSANAATKHAIRCLFEGVGPR